MPFINTPTACWPVVAGGMIPRTSLYPRLPVMGRASSCVSPPSIFLACSGGLSAVAVGILSCRKDVISKSFTPALIAHTWSLLACSLMVEVPSIRKPAFVCFPNSGFVFSSSLANQVGLVPSPSPTCVCLVSLLNDVRGIESVIPDTTSMFFSGSI